MNARSIITITVQSSADVLLLRQRAQEVAQLAGFDTLKQTSFATALSEIVRNALQFAGGGVVDFIIESQRHLHFLLAVVSDRGPGIAQVRREGGHWFSSIQLPGKGITSARKLVRSFSIACPAAGGTIVKLGLCFPENHLLDFESVSSWGAKLAAQKPRGFLEEMQHRNQELLITIEALQLKEIELERQMARDECLKADLAESRQLLEARVLERTESLVISNEELRAFSYTVSHDLRAPLRAINGFIHLLLEDHVKPDDRAAAELTSNILQATSRMDSLIQDLVGYTQITKVPIPLRPVDSRTLVQELLTQCEGRIKPGEVHLETKGEFPMINANPAILQSALGNLLENALKFRDPAKPASILFRGCPGLKTLRLWVEDNGFGIAPEHHDRIFRVFERLHGQEVPGTGIGLALVKRWVAGMHGAVGVESNIGEGARFWIELPLI